MANIKVSKKGDGIYEITRTEIVQDMNELFRIRNRLRQEIPETEKRLAHMKQTLAEVEKLCAEVEKAK
ncbi:MAG: hypothetical protein C4570_00270 [Ammonifex sp.]|jgi:hypothetical protein|nr:MAG: hypothetical protein C4570_00270 [Ammonifex sp.]